MDLEDISILVIVISILTLGFIGFISDMKSINPNITIDSSYNETYSKLEDEMIRINQSQQALFSGGVNSAFTFLPTIQSFFSLTSIILGSLGVLSQIIQDIALRASVPPYIIWSFISVLTISFIFAVYKATLGRLKL